MVQIGAHSKRRGQGGQPADDSKRWEAAPPAASSPEWQRSGLADALGSRDAFAPQDETPAKATDVTRPAPLAPPAEPARPLSPSGASWWPDPPAGADATAVFHVDKDPEPLAAPGTPSPSGSAWPIESGSFSGFSGSSGPMNAPAWADAPAWAEAPAEAEVFAPAAATVGTGTGGWDGGAGAWYAADGQPAPVSKPPRGRLTKVLGIAAAVAVLLAGAGVWYYVQKSGSAQAAGSGRHDRADPPSKTPETVVSTAPPAGTQGINGAAQISVVFSEPLSASSPMPSLKPAIGGRWQVHGATAVFQPATGFRPRTRVKLTIPGGPTGVQSLGGGLLAATQTVTFRTGRLSVVRMEQLLAQLGYLPLTWAPATGTAAPLTDANAQLSAAYSPPSGSYTWQPGYPSQLQNLWRPDASSQILRGAVTAFEADHGLTLDGVVGSGVWRAMFRALAKGAHNTHGYTYALMRQRLPEELTVWHNGTIIFRHAANTGISIRPTAVGTDPVYVRYQSQIMKGRNPDGSKYADQVYWVAYFHSGEAIHYFPRPGYGWPQSLGCIELPYNQAKWLWPYLTYGTLVTVEAP